MSDHWQSEGAESVEVLGFAIESVPATEFEANHWASQDDTDYVETPVPIGAGSK